MDGLAYQRLTENETNNNSVSTEDGCWGKCKRWIRGRGDDGGAIGMEVLVVTEVVEKLQKRLRAMNMQLAGIKHDESQCRQEAAASLRDGDKVAARGHIIIALQHRAHWMREHGKFANLTTTIMALKEAHRNLDTAQLYKHSNVTLGTLLEATGDVEELMESIRGFVDDVGRNSEQLASPLTEDGDPNTVEEEIEMLMQQQYEEEDALVHLPNVSFHTTTTTTTSSSKGAILAE
jgi:hypothetical protein